MIYRALMKPQTKFRGILRMKSRILLCKIVVAMQP